MRHLRGSVVRRSDQQPVKGARVECRAPSGELIPDCSVVITGGCGAFDLCVTARPGHENPPPQPESVHVFDRSGGLLAEMELPGGEDDNPHNSLDILIDDRLLAGGDLPRSVDRVVLRQSALALLRARAAALLDLGRDPDGIAAAAVDHLEAGLPPLATHPTIVALATDVLRGEADAYELFQRELDLLDDWNTRAFGPNVVLLRDTAAELLEPDNQPDAHGSRLHPDRSGPLDMHALHTVVGAAIRVAGGEPVRILASIGVIARQLCPMTDAIAFYALAGGLPSDAETEGRLDEFVDRARLLTEESSESGAGRAGAALPVEAGPARGRRPSTPTGRPIPGVTRCPPGNPWPQVSPLGHFQPLILPLPASGERCRDWIRTFRELERARSYEVTAIEPRDACVGEQVTIRGTGLQFESTRMVLTFPGQAAGSRVEATILGQPTDAEITAQVPAGATCGPVQIHAEGSTVQICGEPYELFLGPVQPYHFEGGLPSFSGPIRVDGQSAGTDGVLRSCVPADTPVLVSWESCGLVTDTDVELAHKGALVWSVTTQWDINELRFPVLDEPTEAVYTITVRLRGRCGTAEDSVIVPTRRTPRSTELEVAFVDDGFENFHRNQRRPRILSYKPASLDHLRAAVVAAEEAGSRLGVTGSRCSYTNCVVPSGTDRMIRMDNLERWLNLDIAKFDPGFERRDWSKSHEPRAPIFLRPVLRTNIRSVVSDSEWIAYEHVSDRPPIEERLVYVEAGMLVEELNCLLDHHNPPLALATMGAGTHQTLAGAISTGTHGSTWRLPPMGDFVRAIHLVGTDGVQWWLEPETRSITDRSALQTAAFAGDLGLKPCTRIRYSDALFNAALVSAGCAGIIYGYVIETVPAHRIRTKVSETTWDDAKRQVRAQFTPGPISLVGSVPTWFFEVVTSPTRDAVIAEKWLTSEPLSSSSSASLVARLYGAADAAALLAVLSAAIASGLAAVAVEVVEAMGELGLLTSLAPGAYLIPGYSGKLVAATKRLDVLRNFLTALANGATILASGLDDQAVADALPNMVELLWRLSPLGLNAGQAALDEIQRRQTLDFKDVPEVAKSFTSLTGQPDGPPAEEPRHAKYLPTQRIIRSSEYAFSLESGLSFVDDLLLETDRLRGGEHPFVLSINIRFTARTVALIGMQQFSPISCHVELFTMSGLAGNVPLDAVADRLVRTHGGVPHWGQLHPEDLDFGALFGLRLDSWRRAISTLADGRSTFRHAFAVDRRLLQ